MTEVLTDHDLITAAAVQAGVPPQIAEAVVRAYVGAMAQTLRHSRSVRIKALGVFHVVPRRAGFAGHRIRFQPNDGLRRAMAVKQSTAAAEVLAQRMRMARALRATEHRPTTTAPDPIAGDANVASD